MELKNTEEIRNEILQAWLQSAWVYPFQAPDGRTYLRLTPGGRLKLRRRIGELERALGVQGAELARQEQAGIPSPGPRRSGCFRVVARRPTRPPFFPRT